MGFNFLVISIKSFLDIGQESNDESPTSKHGVFSHFLSTITALVLRIQQCTTLQLFIVNNHITKGIFHCNKSYNLLMCHLTLLIKLPLSLFKSIFELSVV